MKNFKLYILFLILFTFMACEDLNKLPLTDASEASFLSGKDDLNKAVAGAYDMLQSFAWQMDRFDGLTNNAFARSNIPGFSAMASNQHSPTTGPQSDIWTPAYRGIQRVNFILQNIDRSPVNQATKARIAAEMKTLRAYYYHQLVTFFGGVPIVTERMTIYAYNTISRSTRAEVVTFIIKDLDDAIAVLPDTYEKADYGRMTKGAALAIKARVYLYESDFTNAEIAATAVMNLASSAGYALATDYRKMFTEVGEASSEAVLDIQFLHGSATGECNQIETQTRAYLEIQPEYNVISSYEIIGPVDGPAPTTPSEIVAMWNSGKDPFKGRDPRLGLNVAKAENFNPCDTKMDVRKGSRDNIMTTLFNDRVNYGANWMAIRYADILLMFAEAHNETTGPDTKVQNAVNAVRARASTLLLPVGINLTKEQMRDFIRQERRKEFIYEGLWYNDIRRWGTAFVLSELKKVNYQNHAADFPDMNKYMLLPIPQTEIDKNPNLKQNPGY